MRFYCVELKWSFDSRAMAYLLEGLGLTVIEMGTCLVWAY